MKTASRPRKRASAQGVRQSLRATCAIGAIDVTESFDALDVIRAIDPRGARASKATPKAIAPTSTSVLAAMPKSAGTALANSTPTAPAPSRQLTTRVRMATSPPRRAPQAWCVTLSTLKAT